MRMTARLNVDTTYWSGKNIFTNNLRYLNALRCRYYSYQTSKPHKRTRFQENNSLPMLLKSSFVAQMCWWLAVMWRILQRKCILCVGGGMYVSKQKENFKTAWSHFFNHWGAETNSQKHRADLQSDHQAVMAHLSANNCLLKHPADTQQHLIRVSPPDKFKVILFTCFWEIQLELDFLLGCQNKELTAAKKLSEI